MDLWVRELAMQAWGPELNPQHVKLSMTMYTATSVWRWLEGWETGSGSSSISQPSWTSELQVQYLKVTRQRAIEDTNSDMGMFYTACEVQERMDNTFWQLHIWNKRYQKWKQGETAVEMIGRRPIPDPQENKGLHGRKLSVFLRIQAITRPRAHKPQYKGWCSCLQLHHPTSTNSYLFTKSGKQQQ